MRSFLLLVLLFSGVLRAACRPELTGYSDDCELSERVVKVERRLENFGLRPDQLRNFQALRFIDRSSWEKHLASGRANPWEVYKPAPHTWVFWSRGEQKAREIESQLDVTGLSAALIQDLHRSAMDNELFTKTSYIFKGARPGKIRSGLFTRAPEFFVECKDHTTAEAAALIQRYDLTGEDGGPLIHGEVSLCEDKLEYHGHVKYLSSRKVSRELNRWVVAVNQWHEDFHQGKSSVSPLAAIADFQRWFVSIHPFGDGNGRTSRFLQDILLTHVGLLPVASGDLTDDVLTPKLKYRELFRGALETALSELEACALQYEARNVEPKCEGLPLDLETELKKGLR